MTKTDISAAVHWPIRFFAFGIFVAVSAGLHGAEYPAPRESDYIIRNFKFASGETTPELRIHYRTLGKGEKDEQGKTRNAVLIMHGTTGSGAQFIRPEFAGELFGKDQLLDATKFFIVLPDGSVTANRTNRAMDCTRSFRITATSTWWKRSIDYSPTDSASIMPGW